MHPKSLPLPHSTQTLIPSINRLQNCTSIQVHLFTSLHKWARRPVIHLDSTATQVSVVPFCHFISFPIFRSSSSPQSPPHGVIRAPTSTSTTSPKPPPRRPAPPDAADSGGATPRPSGAGGAHRRPISGDFDGISDDIESIFPDSSHTDDDSQYS